MGLLVVKSIHIIFIISWFTGLFYIGRMFVYHAEAMDKPEPEKGIIAKQLGIMQAKVYKIIMNPAMMISVTAGIIMCVMYGMAWFKINYWLHTKIVLVIVLVSYHVYCKKIMLRLAKGEVPMDSFRFRLFNEIPTILMFLIVELAVIKNLGFPNYLIYTLLILVPLIYMGTVAYRRRRLKGPML